MSTNQNILRPRKYQEPEVVTEEIVLIVVYGPSPCGKTTWIKQMRENDEANGLTTAAHIAGVAAQHEVRFHLERGYSVYWEVNTSRPYIPPAALQEIVDVVRFVGPKVIAEELT